MAVTNKPSRLLSIDENIMIFSLLGEKCCSLATAVVQRYIAGGRSSRKIWQYEDVGILCFVKDANNRSYFFRLYCPNRKCLIWQHELYNFMNYSKLNTFLHSFEAEEYVVGFNFANENEGDDFFNQVNGKLDNNKKTSYAKTSQNRIPKGTHIPSVALPKEGLSFKKRNKTAVKGMITKDMIGLPQDFRHLSHFGFDSRPNFNFIDDEEIKKFYNDAGVSEQDLRDPDTSNYIYNFIMDNGGIEAVIKDLQEQPPSPEIISHQRHHVPPPSYPPPPKPYSNIPPPPPLTNVSLPPVYMTTCPPPSSSDPRSALMESIRYGVSLKPVSNSTNSGNKHSPIQEGGPTGDRNDLLEQIRHGVKLHSVPKNESTPKRQPTGALAKALANALAQRAAAIQSDTDSSSSHEEWDVE